MGHKTLATGNTEGILCTVKGRHRPLFGIFLLPNKQIVFPRFVVEVAKGREVALWWRFLVALWLSEFLPRRTIHGPIARIRPYVTI